MAIQNRRGIFSDLDPTKLLPGEYAVVISGDPDNTDGNGVYICFAPGQVKKIALTEDMSLDGKIYPNLTAGDLLADTYAENKVPYFFRPSGGGAEVGTIESPVLVGGSVGWNQLTRPLEATYWASLSTSSVTFANNTFVATATGTNQMGCYIKPSYRFSIVGHKYLMTADVTASANGNVRFSFNDIVSDTAVTANTKTHIAKILNENTADQSIVIYKTTNNAAGDTLTAENVQCIDLTLLLGSTIADRLYTLEQSTAGSGIAQLRAWGFDFDEYVPYTAPTLKHVEGVSAHVMRDADDNIIGNYPLDASLTLRGIPKLDANNSLYYDGDTYEPDGTVTRRYGIVDLGTLDWSFDTSNTQFYSNAIINRSGWNYNVICSTYAQSSDNSEQDSSPHVRGIANGRVYIVDTSYTDAASFKTAMSGVYLVYEKATTSTETATPFAEYQEVDASGTEEYVSTGVVPVGHDTKYPTDIKGAVESILSAIPSANGTYALKVTVANGKRTFSWV